ncbi:hypothetical protein ABII15_33655 [Streptomyces sp. HUAS MG91]|uniref:Uncharacterized protein n=1 Tax=Streptomyces tabacisoli TaxID=3156398 RepID=A0AAU8J288_9ACTN
MREMVQHRRVETVGKAGAVGPKPQWQNLFVAPAYDDGFFDDVPDEVAVAVPSPARRRRGGRRAA